MVCGSTPTSMGERFSKWFPWAVFSLLILIWIVGILIPLYPQTLGVSVTEPNPYIGLSSAVIGAGPFILYVIYQEYVLSPRFIITTTESEDGVKGVYFDKYILTNNGSVYPLIECVTTVKNVGRTSVTDAAVRVSLKSADTHEEFTSRWTGDLYAPTTDIHPGRERELVLFQIVPTDDCIRKLDISPDDVNYQLSKGEFYSLMWDSEPPEIAESLPGEHYLQRPLNPDSEAYEYDVDDVEVGQERRFIGKNIPSPEICHASLHITSADWTGRVNVGFIPIDETALQGTWYTSRNKYSSLREKLRQIGW